MSHEAAPIPAEDPNAVQAQFESCRYAAVGRFLEGGLSEMLYRHVRTRAAHNALSSPRTTGMPAALEASADPLMENVLSGLLPRVEQLSGRLLHPTYSFVRLYRRGDRLERHLDRASCEISVSVHLGSDGDIDWPLWVAGPCGERAARQRPGDALLYRGADCEHWRDPLEGAEWAQLFLHYVDRQGPHAELRFDRREQLRTKPGG